MILTVAANPDCSMSKVAESAGISQSSVSRNAAALGRYHRRGQAGLDLIEAYEDPMERRRKLLRLTPKGKRLMEGITNQLAGGLS